MVNDLIREALYPYPENLKLVTKVGARRDEAGRILPAQQNRLAATSDLLIALYVGLSIPVIGAGSRARPRRKRTGHRARLRRASTFCMASRT